MRSLLTNKNFVVIMLLTGGSMGYFNALITQMQQFLCARNYEPWVTGAVSASFMLLGTIGGALQAGWSIRICLSKLNLGAFHQMMRYSSTVLHRGQDGPHRHRGQALLQRQLLLHGLHALPHAQARHGGRPDRPLCIVSGPFRYDARKNCEC